MTEKQARKKKKLFNRGWNSAIDSAAKVAEECNCSYDHEYCEGDCCGSNCHCEEIADKIREMMK